MTRPKLESVYGNMSYGSNWYEKWNKAQRVCSENYYSRYFAYSIPVGDISDKAIRNIADESERWKEPFDAERNPLNQMLTPASSETLIKKLIHQVGEINAVASASLAIAVSQRSDVIPNPDILHDWAAPFSQAAMLVSDLIQNLEKIHRTDLAKACIDIAPSLEFKLEIFKWLKREDGNRPEKDAFSEASINDIGEHLGKVVSDALENSEGITKLSPKYIPKIFSTLNKFVRNDYVNEYVDALISKNPESIISILDAYVPAAWGMESTISHKLDFERGEYNSLTSVLDPSVILRAIQDNFPVALKELDNFPEIYDDDAEKGLLFLKQFIWLHRYVLNESQKNDASDESETEA